MRYFLWLWNYEITASNTYPTPVPTISPTATVQCTGAACDYVVIRFYTTTGCTAGSTYGDYAIVTNECNIDTSNPNYKSWINICTDSSYGSIQFVGMCYVIILYFTQVVYLKK